MGGAGCDHRVCHNDGYQRRVDLFQRAASHTGKQMSKGRLRGNFSASPVLVGDQIYATSEEGTTYVYQASPEAFKLLATNQLGDEVFATPTVSRGRIYARIAFRDGEERQEMLYCLEASD